MREGSDGRGMRDQDLVDVDGGGIREAEERMIRENHLPYR